MAIYFFFLTQYLNAMQEWHSALYVQYTQYFVGRINELHKYSFVVAVYVHVAKDIWFSVRRPMVWQTKLTWTHFTVQLDLCSVFMQILKIFLVVWSDNAVSHFYCCLICCCLPKQQLCTQSAKQAKQFNLASALVCPSDKVCSFSDCFYCRPIKQTSVLN